MNTEKFEAAVKNRANRIVQANISEFERAIGDAIRKLDSNLLYGPYEDKAHVVMAYLESGKKWPKILWENAEDNVRKQLFDLMDPIQKALNAPPPAEGEYVPVEETEK